MCNYGIFFGINELELFSYKIIIVVVDIIIYFLNWKDNLNFLNREIKNFWYNCIV